MAVQVATLLVKVQADVDRAGKNLDTLNRKVEDVAKVTGPATTAAKAFGLAAVAGFGVLGTQAVTGGVLQFTAALGPMVGLAAAAPAVLAGAAGAFGALKIATLGVGDALKEAYGSAEDFQEAIKDLSPNAQEFAQSIRDTKAAFTDLRLGVQDALFQDLNRSVDSLASAYLPALKAPLSAIASEFGRGARETAGFLSEGQQVGAVTDLLGHTNEMVKGLASAMAPLTEGFLAFATGGQSALGDLGGAVESLATRFRDFATQARDSGQITEWIENGKDVAQDFWGVLKNLGGSIQAIFSAARGVSGGFLENLETLTGSLRTFLESAAGQDALATFFQAASEAAGVLAGVIPSVLGVISALAPVLANIATGVGPGLTAFLDALAPQIASLAPLGLQLGEALGVFLQSLIPLLPQVAAFIGLVVQAATAVAPFGPQIMAVVAAFYALKAAAVAATAISAVTSGLGLIVGGATGAAGAIGRFSSGLTNSAAASSAFSGRAGTMGGAVRSFVTAIGSGIAAAARWAASIVVSAATAAASFVAAVGRMIAQAVIWSAQMVARAAVAVASFAVSVAAIVGGYILMAVTAMAQAAIMAAAWFVALGPVGWVIALVVGLVALIIANWDTVKAKTIAAWNAVSAAVKAAWQAVTSAVSSAVARVREWISSAWANVQSMTSGAWGRITAAVSSGIQSMLGFVRAIPGNVLSALGNLGSLLFGAGRSIIQGLVNGIRNMAGAVTGAVRGVLQAARNLLPFSPAKEGPFSGKGWTLYSGQSISQALADGMTDRVRKVASAASALASAAHPDLGGLSVPGTGSGAGTRPSRARAEGVTPESVQRGAMAGGGVTFQFTTYNPVAEAESVTQNKALDRVAVLGLVG